MVIFLNITYSDSITNLLRNLFLYVNVILLLNILVIHSSTTQRPSNLNFILIHNFLQ